MKHRNALLQWAQRWHYPYLCLADGSHIKHGLEPWRRAARNPHRAALAWQQIARWEERIAASEKSA